MTTEEGEVEERKYTGVSDMFDISICSVRTM